MKYWLCAVDDFSDKTWTHFAKSKNQMVAFVEELVTTINGLGYAVKYIRCNNAGEHQTQLQDYCREKGITLEYTAPNTPTQNGRAEKKIHVLWQRAMVQMVNANLTISSQNDFWAESVACANYLEDLTIKAGGDKPALGTWTNESTLKWFKHLVQFGRIAVVNKCTKLSGKMINKGFPAMMVGYAPNHGAGTYRLYNPKTNRIVYSRDISWMEYKPKTLEEEFNLFEPGIESITPSEGQISRGENDHIPSVEIDDDSSETSASSNDLQKALRFKNSNKKRVQKKRTARKEKHNELFYRY